MNGTGPPDSESATPRFDPEAARKSTNDKRHIVHPPKTDKTDVNSNSLTLRPYQREAVDAVIKGFGEFRRQLRVCPTGGGKTIEFAALALHYQPGKTLIIAHRDELIEQARDKIARFAGLPVQIEKAEQRASLDAPVVVASIQTLCRRNPFPADHFRLVVVDEAHHVLSESYQRVLANFGGAYVLGVTATPDRGDKKLLSDFFENVASETTLIDLVKDGYLSRIRVKTLPIKIDLSGVRVMAGDYSDHDLGHVLQPYLESIADILARDYPTRQSLAFLPLCSVSERFATLCQERGIAAEHVAGDSPDRKEILARFHAGETRLVSCAQLLCEGYDNPAIDLVLPLSPTKVRSLFSQQIGRGTRIAPGKDHLLVLDPLWLSSKHNLIRPATLVANDEEEANAVPREGDLVSNVEAFRQRRFEALAREIEARKHRRPHEFDFLDEFAVVIGDRELAEYAPVVRWHTDPVSQRQLDFLTQMRHFRRREKQGRRRGPDRQNH